MNEQFISGLEGFSCFGQIDGTGFSTDGNDAHLQGIADAAFFDGQSYEVSLSRDIEFE